ncbi:MAG: phosphoglucosamine mutase [Pseudomonadota bacterium]
MGRYFGTDGVRGRVGEQPMTVDFAVRLASAAGRVLIPDGGSVAVGKDPRISGYMFESALEAGFVAAGVDVKLLQVMPTPGIAYLTRVLGADLGVVISASHNSFADNGIKFFDRTGSKLSDDVEARIEQLVEEAPATRSSERLGRAERRYDAVDRYHSFCTQSVPLSTSLAGLRIVIDGANGATYKVAPRIFSDLGADVITIGCSPNGKNINEGCGSTCPELLQNTVRALDADLGIAFDGDGDRLVMVCENGELLDGDELLHIIVQSRLADRALRGPVVGTLMTNLGLEVALKEQNVEFLRAPVGDRNVLAFLKEHGGVIGGETSGHIICLDRTTTGDGILGALQVLAAMSQFDKPLSELRGGMTKYPQTMINVQVERRFDPATVPAIAAAVEDIEQTLGNEGRVVLRASGTEPLIRVMIEGSDAGQVETLAGQLADVVREAVPAQN